MLLFWILALGLAAIQAWNSRFDMFPDGIQYLDNADAYFRGDWHNAANTYWSPMYSWLLGAALHALRPSPYWEFPVLHLVNFCIFAGAAGAFCFFLSELRLRAVQPATRPAITAIACATFLYAMLDFTNVVIPTPDLTMAIFVFLAAALLVRIGAGEAGPAAFLGLGFTLGLGYLAKAPFFVFSAVCFAMLIVLVFKHRAAGSRVLLAAAAFAIIAAPYIAFLSFEKGRLTYGESGKYNLAWLVNGIPYYHWQGGPPGSGTPLHPTRKLSDQPPVYEFAMPIIGTFPPWYDPSYWYQGAKVRYRLTDFQHAGVRGVRTHLYLFRHRQVPLITGLAVLVLLAPRKWAIAAMSFRIWPALVFASVPFVVYALVHVEGRFLGAFLVLLWTLLFTAATSAVGELPPATIHAVAATVTALMLVEAALVSVPSQPLHELHDKVTSVRSPNPHWEIAKALSGLGVRPGDRAARIGTDLEYSWARLARVQIVAEVLPPDADYDRFAHARRAAEWEHAREVLRTTPAKFVVSPAIPGIVDQPGWERLGNTPAFIYRLTF